MHVVYQCYQSLQPFNSLHEDRVAATTVCIRSRVQCNPIKCCYQSGMHGQYFVRNYNMNALLMDAYIVHIVNVTFANE